LDRRKYGILKFGRFWRIGVCIAERIRREFALRNYTPPQLSVLFVTVHTNAVFETRRTLIADLIGGGGSTDVCGKHSSAAVGCFLHTHAVNFNRRLTHPVYRDNGGSRSMSASSEARKWVSCR